MSIPAAFYRASLNFNSRGNSGTRSITFGVNYVPITGAPEMGTPEFFEAAQAFYSDEVWPTIAVMIANNTQLVSLGIQITDGGGTIPYADGPIGANAGALAPPQMALIAQWYSTTPGRRGRGRCFFPDTFEGDWTEAGSLDDTARATYASALTEFIGIHDDNVFPDSTFGNSVNGLHILHADGGTPSRITAGNIAPTPGWIRGRGRS